MSSSSDYEEDFEGDDEGPPQGVEAKEKKSSPPSGETERRVDERDASETEDDERDGGLNLLFEHTSEVPFNHTLFIHITAKQDHSAAYISKRCSTLYTSITTCPL